MAQQSSFNPTSLTRQGQLNSAGDARALYLKLFSGEMFKGFQHESIARDIGYEENIEERKESSVHLHR